MSVRFRLAPEMIFKLRQFLPRARFTISNRLPSRRSRQYLLNHLAYVRRRQASGALRASMGFLC
jgi:hypothetical protein